VAVCFAAAAPAAPPAIGQTILVVPFENLSRAPGLEWIGESFPELLRDRLVSPTMYVLSRDDRLRAYDRLGVPADVHLSRATVYRLAELMDVDYVILGTYNFDGNSFTATCQLLDMRREHLLPQVSESGPLLDLIDLQTAMAWDILHTFRPNLSVSKPAFIESAPPVRLDAFEHYVRGIIETNSQEQIRHFREAVRLNPDYPQALLQLGKAYYRNHAYDDAESWLGKVPLTAPEAREANFFLGLAAYAKGDYDRAESAFTFVASRLPLAEVYNNLGAAQLRRGEPTAVESFQKASDSDPTNPDYHFNLALCRYRAGDIAGASRQLHEALQQNPDDSGASEFLNGVIHNATARTQQVSTSHLKLPTERIRTNYDESSFRQLALKIEAAAEQRLAKADPRTHAQYHADRGEELLRQGFIVEAEPEFRESISLDPTNAQAHAGLASVLETKGDLAGARTEADSALRLRQFAEPLLVLARLDLRENKPGAAVDSIDRALLLEPANAQAQALKRAVAAKLAQKAQPLPNQ
jgi:Flp pilus assembly protein TadD/TolB-like protein